MKYKARGTDNFTLTLINARKMAASREHNAIFNLLYLQDECNDARLVVVFHPIIYARGLPVLPSGLICYAYFLSRKKNELNFLFNLDI